MNELNLTELTNESADTYREKTLGGWIEIIVAIYEFGLITTVESQVKWLNDRGMKINAKANAFSAAAKIAFAQEIDGKWDYSAAQVSRYSTICNHLRSNSVKLSDAPEYLAGKRIKDIVAAENSSQEIDDDQASEIKFGEETITNEFSLEKVARQKDDGLYLERVSSHSNLGIVVVDDDGKITAVRLIDDQKYLDTQLAKIAKAEKKRRDQAQKEAENKKLAS